MAKTATSSAPTAKRGETRCSPVIEGLDLFYPILVDCNLDWQIPPEGDEKPERFYDAGLRIAGDEDKGKATIAACIFSAGQKIKGKKAFEISATYMIAVHHSGGRAALHSADRKKLLEESASTSAWPLFRALYAHMGSQTNLELPLLPNVPKLRWIKAREETSKEDKKDD